MSDTHCGGEDAPAVAVAAVFARAAAFELQVLTGDLTQFGHHDEFAAVGGPMTGRVRGGRFAARRAVAAGVDLVLTGHLLRPSCSLCPSVTGLPMRWAPGRCRCANAVRRRDLM